MPTVLSPNKGYPLQQTGENSGTWGVVLDGGISTTDLNMGGRLSLDVSGGGSVTLTATQASNLVYTFTGVLTGAKAVLFPAVGSFYIVRNQTTGAFALTVKTSAGGSVGPTIPQGATWAIFTDGTNGVQQQSGVAYGVDSGTAAAYVVTTDAGATATYPGSVIIWTAASTNTSPATMAADGGAVKTLYQPSASGPIQAVAGYVVAGDTLISVYNPALNTGTGGWFTIGGIPSFSSITVADSLTITSTDAGAGAAPVLEMYRNSATPASADLLGEMLWTGQNSTPVKATYSFIEARLDNPVAAAETATLLFATAQAGTVAARMGLAAGLVVGAPTGGDKGAGAINAAALYANGVQISIFPLLIAGLIPTSIGGNNTTAGITFSSGQCIDSTGSNIIIRSSSLSWSVSNGNAVNGYQGGTTLPNGTQIHWFLISGASGTGTFAHTTLTPTLPSGFTLYRHIFSQKTTSAGALFPGTTTETGGGGYRFMLSTTAVVAGGVPTTTSGNLTDLIVPGSIAGLQAIFDVMLTGPNNGVINFLVTDPASADDAVTATRANMRGGTPSIQALLAANFTMGVNASGQIRTRSDVATGSFTIDLLGYIDPRRV